VRLDADHNCVLGQALEPLVTDILDLLSGRTSIVKTPGSLHRIYIQLAAVHLR
jgi:hypothetical protein